MTTVKYQVRDYIIDQSRELLLDNILEELHDDIYDIYFELDNRVWYQVSEQLKNHIWNSLHEIR